MGNFEAIPFTCPHTSTAPYSTDKLLYTSTIIVYTEKKKTKREKNVKCPK
jgi:hypothetical protein